MEKTGEGPNQQAQEDTSEQCVGVGVFFKKSDKKQAVVESLLPSGSAARAGGIEVGDVLIKVGGVLCDGLSMDRIRSLLLGPLGSYVVLAFRRRAVDGSFFYYDIELVRASGGYLDLLERFVSF
jgi:C-terminal processing protease CtpA/Prc